MKEETLDKIDRYLRNEMTEDEKRAFENILAGDDALRRQVELCSDIIEAIEKRQMKEQLSLIDKSLHRRKKMFWWSGAASVLVACTLFGIIFLRLEHTDPSVIPSTYIGVRGETYNQDVVKLLTRERYDEAINLIDSLEKEYMSESAAIRQKEMLTEEESYELASDSIALYQLRWFRIQALIGNRKTEKAKSLLEQYKKQAGEYQGKADSLWQFMK